MDTLYTHSRKDTDDNEVNINVRLATNKLSMPLVEEDDNNKSKAPDDASNSFDGVKKQLPFKVEVLKEDMCQNSRSITA
jgi:hypothetical protein